MTRAAVDGREAELGDMRQQVVVGNACGRKSTSHGSKEILLSHASGMEPRGFQKCSPEAICFRFYLFSPASASVSCSFFFFFF